MRARITHSFTYSYDAAVLLGPHRFCLKPRGHGFQRLLSFQLEISPEPSRLYPLVAASGDKIKYLKPYAESISLKFPILADPTRTTAINWTVVGDGRELPHRWIFLIGQDGKIAAVLSEFAADDAGRAVFKRVQELGWVSKP